MAFSSAQCLGTVPQPDLALTEPEPMRPGAKLVKLELDATSWVFPAGHRLRLSLAGFGLAQHRAATGPGDPDRGV